MKKNNIKKVAITLATLQALSMCGCARSDVKNENVEEKKLELVMEGESKFSSFLGELSSKNKLDINDNEYKEISSDNIKSLSGNCLLFDEKGRHKGLLNGEYLVYAIKSNGEYTYIRFDNGECYYVLSSSLTDLVNVVKNSYEPISGNLNRQTNYVCNLYDVNGKCIKVITPFTNCVAFSSNGEYTYVNINDSDVYGYIEDKFLNEIYINDGTYAYPLEDIDLYSDEHFTRKISKLDRFEPVFLGIYDDDWVYVFNDDVSGYVRRNELVPLDSKFIDIDLTHQTIDFYKDNQLEKSSVTRTGNDDTPTHVGINDIDYKCEEFEFPKFPGSKARYWISYDNENEEGIHDLVGDDEKNYGNQAYHRYGSHGCVRVPVDASEYAYNNYNEGDYVLVHK